MGDGWSATPGAATAMPPGLGAQVPSTVRTVAPALEAM